MRKQTTAALAAMLVAVGCSQEPTGVSGSELALAQDAQRRPDPLEYRYGRSQIQRDSLNDGMYQRRF